MFKKIIAAFLAAVLVLSLAACGKKEKEPTEPIEAPTKKVAVLVAPEAQYPEDYKAAAELADAAKAGFAGAKAGFAEAKKVFMENRNK